MKEIETSKGTAMVRQIISSAKEGGISALRLAERAGFHPSSLRRWNNGRTRPLYDDVLQLEKACNELLEEITQ